MPEIFWEILLKCSLFSILVPICIGALTWKNQSRLVRYFIVGQAIYFIVFLGSMYFKTGQLGSAYNFISAFTDCLFLSIVYHLYLKRNLHKNLVLAGCALSCSMLVFDYIYLNRNGILHQPSFLFKNGFVLVASMLVLAQILVQIKIKSLGRNPIFLIAFTKLFLVSYSTIFESVESLLLDQHLSMFLILYASDLLIHVFGQFSYAIAIFLSQRFNFKY
jgi:hypothetical protein